MDQKKFFLVVGVIFLLVGILHALRLLYGWQAVIGNATIPMWISVPATFVAGYLSYKSFKLAKTGN